MPDEHQPDEHQNVVREIEEELASLRDAILARDVAAVERHTAATSERLVRLKQLLDGPPAKVPLQELRALHASTRSLFRLLLKARRTVQALLAVYRSFPEPPPHAFLEQR